MSNRIVARTNNALERFKREMNAAFATPHPNMATFVTTIEELSRRHVSLIEAARGRRVAHRPVETIILPTAPNLDTAIDSGSSEDEDMQQLQNHDGGDESGEDADEIEHGRNPINSNGESSGAESDIEPDFSYDYEAVL
jgi:hypothetical protein